MELHPSEHCSPPPLQAENEELMSVLAAARARLLVMHGAYDLARAASHMGDARAADLELELASVK